MKRVALFACVVPLLMVGQAPAAPLTCANVRNGACMVADTFSLEFDGAGQPLAVMNFGLFSSVGNGQYQTVCEEAFGGRTPERMAVANGRVVVPGLEGIYVSADASLCTWVRAVGLPAATYVQQAVVDPLVPSRVWALVGAGDTRGLYISEDQGATFSLRHAFARGEIWWRLFVLPTVPRKIYVAGPGLVGPAALSISLDDGQTFVARDPIVDLADPLRTPTLLDVSTDAPHRLFFARDTAGGTDELWLSDDDGVSVKRVVTLPTGHFLGGFAFGATQQTVYAGSRAPLFTGGATDAALLVSQDGGRTWAAPLFSPKDGPRFRCLKYREGTLYACAGGIDGADAAYIMQSADGITWAPTLTMAQVQAPSPCVRPLCLETAAWLCTTYGVCAPPANDAGTNDAGTGSSSSGGCSCKVAARSPQRAWQGLGAAAFAIYLACRKRRRLRA